MARRVSVKVLLEVDTAGNQRPRVVTWEDGREYPVDRLLDVRPAPSLKVGGSGMRYTCRIQGHAVYLFEDRGQWFMEGR